MDSMIRALMADDTVKLTAVTGREMCEHARSIHGLSRVCTAALGRTLMMTCMMGAELKGEGGKVTSIVKGGGPAGNIVCTANSAGAVKGYIENPMLELPPGPDGKLDVSMAVGWFGELTVIKDLGMKEPYVGRCALVSGEIAEDFAQYFVMSEQQPSMIYLGVRVDIESGEVRSAGGLMVQPLPHCPEEVLSALESCAAGVGRLSLMLEEGKGLKEAVTEVFEGMGVRFTEQMDCGFRCDCSRERLEKVLISLGREELEDMMAKEHGAQLSCHFCNSKYSFGEQELSELLREAQEG